LKFDERAVWDEYIRFRAQKAVTDHIRQHFNFPTFSYAVVEHSVETIVSSVCERLHVVAEELEAGVAALPVATRGESPAYGKFAEGLNELIERRKDQILPNTVRMLSQLVGVGPDVAEGLAQSSS
jgi:hypothetical protein